ncbi:MAG: DEAD/DEAH box helicase [Anaerolineae bacterium]|nr:DEAD/DEAH box helicase [Anaerolineae bacterium]
MFHTTQLTGTIKWYSKKRGYGFVAPDTGGTDIFVHQSALAHSLQDQLKKGDRIAFVVQEHSNRPAATSVTPLQERAAPPTQVKDNSQFADLALIPQLLQAVREAGYREPTPIQTQAIPYVLAGRDLLGCAQTGTGKTAAFALPILQHLSSAQPHPQRSSKHQSNRHVRVLVLSPTRELAIQIGESFNVYGQHTGLTNAVIYGGVGANQQIAALRRGVDILIATPGRLLDLMGQGYVKLERTEVLVLDEADRMLDMGFIRDVKRIIKQVPDRRQTLLFSATLPAEIIALAGNILHNPVEVSITPEQPTIDAIEQAVVFVPKQQKQALLQDVLQDPVVTRALVFTRTKHGANRTVKNLNHAGIQAEAIHGNKSQTARQKALDNFRDGKTRVLVATDVVARGIDVELISHVIQFDLPTEPETYVHRIGRTGRAGAGGIALSFCSDDERPMLRDIQKLIQMRIPALKEHPG